MGEIIIKPRTLKSGKVVYEYAFEIASVDGKRKRKTKSGFKTKREAREAGRLAQQTYENIGRPIEPSEISVADFFDKWIENDCKLSCKDVTVKGYEKKIRLYIKPSLGEYKLKSITKEILQTFITKMFNEGFSRNTISSVRGIITKAFDYAVDNHYIKYFCDDKLNFIGKAPNYIVSPINRIKDESTKNEINFVCRRENGSYITPRTMQHVSSVIHKQLNFPEYDTHSLRHTHATMLMENGVDIVYIQHRLGHKDISVTMNIYTNHTPVYNFYK